MSDSPIDDITLARFMNKLNPETVRANLAEAGGFLALFELLRSEVILTPASLFVDVPPVGRVSSLGDIIFTRFESGKLIPSKRYREVVLKNESTTHNAFRRAADWLASMSAISLDEVDELMAIRDYRNEVAHELMNVLIDPDRRLDPKRTARAVELLGKISRWRIRNLEAEEECMGVPDEEITSGKILIGEIIIAGLTGRSGEHEP